MRTARNSGLHCGWGGRVPYLPETLSPPTPYLPHTPTYSLPTPNPPPTYTPPTPYPGEQTNTCENITFLQLLLRTVMTKVKCVFILLGTMLL